MSNPYTGSLARHIDETGDAAARFRCPRGRFAEAVHKSFGDLELARMAVDGPVALGPVFDEYVAARMCVAEAVPIATSFADNRADVDDIIERLGKARADSKRLWSKDRKASAKAKAEAERIAGELAHARLRHAVIEAVKVSTAMLTSLMLDAHVIAARNVATALYALNGRARWVIQGSDCSTYWEGENEPKRPPRLSRFARVFLAGSRYTIDGPGAVDDVDLEVVARSVARVIGSDPTRTFLSFNEESRGGLVHFGARGCICGAVCLGKCQRSA